jgi:hypothetical protein
MNPYSNHPKLNLVFFAQVLVLIVEETLADFDKKLETKNQNCKISIS